MGKPEEHLGETQGKSEGNHKETKGKRMENLKEIQRIKLKEPQGNSKNKT